MVFSLVNELVRQEKIEPGLCLLWITSLRYSLGEDEKGELLQKQCNIQGAKTKSTKLCKVKLPKL